MYVFKRITLLFALMVVEIFLFILFLLFYTKVLWVSWNAHAALYIILGLIPVFVATLLLFIRNRNKLNNSIQHVKFVEAVLLKKIQLGLLHRKIIIWTYEYTIGNKKIKKNYWNFVKVKELENGDHFMLAVDNENELISYFPLTATNN